MSASSHLRERVCRFGMGLVAISTLLSIGAAAPPLTIIRHDAPDEEYVALAKDIPAAAAVVRYSTTDVAGTLIAPRWVLSAAHVAEAIEEGRNFVARGTRSRSTAS